MRMRLGDILIAQGVIDQDQLTQALSEAALWGRRVGEVLIGQGVCDEQQILDALARQLNVEAAPLSTTIVIPERVLRLVPPSFAREHLVIPLYDDADGGVLEVALADPADQERLDELRFHTGREIRPFVALPSELGEAIARFYPEEGAEPTPAPTFTIAIARTPTPTPTPAPTNEDEDDEDDIEIESTSAPESALHAELDRLRHDVKALLAAQRVLLQQLDAAGVLDPREFRRHLDNVMNDESAA